MRSKSPAQTPSERGGYVQKIDDPQAQRQRRPLWIVVELPPSRIGWQCFGAWPEPHVGDSHQRENDVIAQRRMTYALSRQRRESGVELGRHVLHVVVVFEQ